MRGEKKMIRDERGRVCIIIIIKYNAINMMYTKYRVLGVINCFPGV